MTAGGDGTCVSSVRYPVHAVGYQHFVFHGAGDVKRDGLSLRTCHNLPLLKRDEVGIVLRDGNRFRLVAASDGYFGGSCFSGGVRFCGDGYCRIPCGTACGMHFQP